MILAFDVWASFGTWGTPSLSAGNVAWRDTQLHPGKSAIVGLIGAAMGMERAGLPGLAAELRTACRTDAVPTRMPQPDYESIRRAAPLRDEAEGPSRRASRFEELRHMEVLRRGKAAGSILSRRSYWSAGGWTVFVSGAEALLRRCASALEAPVYQLCAGRRCCSLAVPPAPALLRAEGLAQAALEHPPLPERLRAAGEAGLAALLAGWRRPGACVLTWEEGFPQAPRAMARRLVRQAPLAAPAPEGGAPSHLLRLFAEHVECSASALID